ncbi:two-component system sensor histidine kinase/response regulator hybrid [Christiangramia forsetii KT0803]|uniref:histidine kinase n=1 Tax=Christiangramia forsetii (strain DSM 17595 / CGMCC 1.15422 / KT0803) TaxID=411154 RepID=A0M222_CHRFK|nr:two-component system sensor histidine kinase/response regulator hybrid [Christiangramia forsetii KT0803]
MLALIKQTILIYRPIISLLLFFGCYLNLSAQNQISFERISTNDGLSQSDINAIYQDKTGFIWFGTHDGLNKFNGYNFTVYKPKKDENSISSNLIFSITGDKKGNLWIGTTGSGLNFFDKTTDKFTTYRNDKKDANSLSNDHITCLFLDKKGRLWIGTRDGLNLLDLRKSKNEYRFQRFYIEKDKGSPENNTIYSIFEDSSGEIWAGGQIGLYKLKSNNEGATGFSKVNKDLNLPEGMVEAIAQDDNGKLFFGTSDGLYFLSDQTQQTKNVVRLVDGFFNDIQIDKENNIWGGTNKGLIYLENGKLPVVTDHFQYDPRNLNSLSKNIVKSLYTDDTGIIWVGTNGGGINKFDPGHKDFRHIRKTTADNSLSYDKIRAMYEDSNGTLWIGTEGGGLNMLLEEDNRNYSGFKNFETVLKPFALSEIEIDNKKTLLIGAEGTPSFYKLDISNPEKIKESDIIPIPEIEYSVFSFLTDSNENLWIGTYRGGVHRWVKDSASPDGFKKQQFLNEQNNPNSISDNIIRSIYEDSKGNIWFATGDGLARLKKDQIEKENPDFINYKHQKGDTTSISHDYILSLHESKDGALWIGTFGGGLDKFIPASQSQPERFISYSEEDGLPNNVIKGILEDEKGNLWLSTNKGLSRFNPEKETFKNFNVNDGLQNNEFQELAFLKRDDGEMLFGGINGFNAFYPSKIIENPYPPETVITNFSIANKPVKIDEKLKGRIVLDKSITETENIKVKYNQNNISFEFAGLHYASPKKNKYAYKLEGFDEDWIYTDSEKRFATYTNLNPGDYILKIKSTNNDGIWDPTPAELAIEVIPPFWMTNTAYVIYFLLFIALLYALLKYTIISTTKKHQLEMEHLEKEKNEELQQMKMDFFTNVSHEFRTPLTLIKGPLEYLQQKGKDLDYSIIENQYAMMYKNTKYLLRLLTQLLDFEKMDQGKMKLTVREGNIVKFLKEVGEPFKFISEKKNIEYKFETEKSSITSCFDPDALEKIMNNLLSNAFKFCPIDGYVLVKIKIDKKQIDGQVSEVVVIEVTDSGAGISAAKKERIFKRFYSKDISREKQMVGTGIGLSYTKSLVDHHLGTINIDKNEKGGSTFVISLPKDKSSYINKEGIKLYKGKDKEILLNPANSSSYLISLSDEKNDKNIFKDRPELPIILVVDDNKDIRKFIRQSLQDNYNIQEAENGREGFEKAKEIVPNIIISDLIMPEMDGIEFCHHCKNDPATSHIPFLLLTAKDSQESELVAMESGADDYLIKPFNLELLQLKLKNIITKRNHLRKRFNREIILKPEDVTVTSADEKFLQQAMDIVENNMMNTDFSVEMLVKEMGLSRSNLYLKLKEITGLSSSEFIRSIRLKRAVQLLEKSDLSVKEIMYMTGFNTASYFAKCFKKQFGKTPSEYVNKLNNT